MSLMVLIVSRRDQAERMLRAQLESNGYSVCRADSSRKAVELAEQIQPQVIVVDGSLPDSDLRETSEQVSRWDPVRRPLLLMLPDEAGGRPDDEAVAAALISLLGSRSNQLAVHIDCHGLRVDRDRHVATIDGLELSLTLTEFRILWQLAERPGFVTTRNELSESLPSDQPIQQRTIDAHIKSIRQKLGLRADLIETVRGLGYRFRDCVACSPQPSYSSSESLS